MARRSRLRKGNTSRSKMRLAKPSQIIVDIRKMTPAEFKSEGWQDTGRTAVIVLADGTKIFPSIDEEGNDGGVLFGEKNKKKFYLFGNKR